MAANNLDHRKPIEISGIQKRLYGFYFFPADATDIKVALKIINLSQRHLVSPKRQTDVRDSLNEKPVLSLDFIEILNALIDKKIVTLEEGKTIEGLLELPDVDERHPLGLSQEDFDLKKDSINRDRMSLSQTAITTISALLFKKKLDIEKAVSQIDLIEKTLRSFLRGASIQKYPFLTILNLLAKEGVIKEPETSFQDLLSNATQEQEEGLTAATNTTTNCMAPNGTQSAAMAVVSQSRNGAAR